MWVGFESLKVLSLQSNYISVIQDGAFEGLNKLKLIDLGSNKLSDIRGPMWKGLESLKILSLPNVLELRGFPAIKCPE